MGKNSNEKYMFPGFKKGKKNKNSQKNNTVNN